MDRAGDIRLRKFPCEGATKATPSGGSGVDRGRGTGDKVCDRFGLRQHGDVAALQDKRLALHVRGGIAFHGRRDRFVFGRNEVPRGLGTPCGPADLVANACTACR
jgi:hypothetical protein